MWNLAGSSAVTLRSGFRVSVWYETPTASRFSEISWKEFLQFIEMGLLWFRLFSFTTSFSVGLKWVISYFLPFYSLFPVSLHARGYMLSWGVVLHAVWTLHLCWMASFVFILISLYYFQKWCCFSVIFFSINFLISGDALQFLLTRDTFMLQWLKTFVTAKLKLNIIIKKILFWDYFI